MITLVRVDDRLLHGQVIHAWVPATASDTLVVVAGAGQREVFELELGAMADEGGLEIRVLEMEGALRFLRDRANESRRVMVVLGSIAMAEELQRAGLSFGVLNIGNVHHREYAARLSASAVVTEDERKAIERMMARGVSIDTEALPRRGGS